MKTILGLLAVLCINNTEASALKLPEYYSASFQLEKIEPMCPPSVPNGATCMGLGIIATVSANIGCADTVIYKDFSVVPDGSKAVITAVSVIKRHPDADRIRCMRAQDIRQKIVVNLITNDVEVINLEVTPAYQD